MICDLGYAIRGHVKALMQLLTNHLPQYGMQLLTTKCLNTAAMIWYLFLGDKDIGRAWYCDSADVQARTRKARASPSYADHPVNPLNVLKAFRGAMMDAGKAAVGRTLFYVILTDCAPPSAKGGRAGFFPGHVFVIEKNLTAAGGIARYQLYQSYINHYDLDGHYDRLRKSVSMSATQAADVVAGLERLFSHPVWDATDTAFWKRLTHVAAPEMEGMKFAEASYFCYTTIKTTACLENLKAFVTAKLGELEAGLGQGRLPPDAIYGDASRYRAGMRPLTNAQMRDDLRRLLTEI